MTSTAVKVQRNYALRAERLAKGFSLVEVARLCGVNEQTYSRYEKGVALTNYCCSLPNVQTAILISEVMGCTVNHLFSKESYTWEEHT